jgi:hypothetical protein
MGEMISAADDTSLSFKVKGVRMKSSAMKCLFALMLCSVWLVEPIVARAENASNPSAVTTLNPIVEWNRNLLALVRTAGAQPRTIHPPRSFAIMHAAMYDAVNNIVKTHRPYLVALAGVPGKSSQEAAATAAAHRVLVALYPSFQATLDLEFQQSLAAIPDGIAKTWGISIGEAVADRVLAARANDNSDALPPIYVTTGAPGNYRATPNNFTAAVFTHRSKVTPFVLQRADQFRSALPPELSSETYTRDFNEVKSLGDIASATRTAEQATIGRFWNGAIQNYWNEIAQTASLAHNLNTAKSARLFALLNLSFADAVIAFYDGKYTYNVWRPVTAIRLAADDSNPNTAADANWLPLNTNTAADPAYPGAHATISAIGALVLRAFFHQDRFDFTATSEVLPGVQRSFTRFSEAASEATDSRVFAGQHFRFDLTSGQRLGRRIASLTLKKVLTPIDFDDDMEGSDPAEEKLK